MPLLFYSVKRYLKLDRLCSPLQGMVDEQPACSWSGGKQTYDELQLCESSCSAHPSTPHLLPPRAHTQTDRDTLAFHAICIRRHPPVATFEEEGAFRELLVCSGTQPPRWHS
jgi:hypothetical protein